MMSAPFGHAMVPTELSTKTWLRKRLRPLLLNPGFVDPYVVLLNPGFTNTRGERISVVASDPSENHR